MATSKQSFVRATEPQYSVSAQREEEMHVKAPLMTMYVHNGSAPGLQPYSQAQHGALQDTTVVPLFLPGMCSNQPLSALTLQISNSTALQQQRLCVPAISSRPKSIGKHVCQHCGKDCLKPSVLEKHLRCHTGERPYPCITCGISFKTQSNLYKHKRTQAHARLSNESDKGTFSSQESMDILKDSCISLSSVMHAKDSADINKSDDGFPVVSVTTHSQVHPVECKIHKADVDRFSTPLALQDKASFLSKTVELSSDVKDNSLHKNPGASCNNGRGPLTPNRTPLQRQEALFCKPWESPASRGKSQSHDSTDSGFSDSCEHHLFSSPGSSLHDPSVELLAETSMEHQELDTSQAPSKMSPDDPKSKVSIQEKQKLEERISKLIYENSVLVEDKQLETVRPRKTILSKQGSIDLPVPYTYKDSFHFEIRSSKHIASSQKQDRGGGAIYRSVPTQHSTSPEHAPLTRSSSLPFSVGSKCTDGVNNTNLSRRCSAGHVYSFRSTDQVPSHRSLVRQAAIDCLPPLDGSSVDIGSISSLSSDGDSTEIGTESTIKGNYRKKTRKFDYTKWHTYKGGTFTKLYNTDRDGPLNTKKTMSGIEQTESFQISQPRDNASVSLNLTSCSIVCLSKTCDMSLTQKPNQASSSYVVLKSPTLEKTAEESKQIMTLQNDPKHSSIENSNVRSADVEMKKIVIQSTDCHLPSERKKQRTTNDVHMLGASCPRKGPVNANLCGLVGQPLLPTCGSHSSIKVNVPHIHPQSSLVHQFTNPSQLVCKTPSPTYCFINMRGKSGSSTLSTSIPALSEAKTSFPPKYQLKIPYSTDGALASCSVSTSAPKTSQTLPALSQNHPTTVQCHLENSLPSSKQGQAASKVAVCETTSIPMLLVSSSGQLQTNTVSSALTQLCTTPTSNLHVSPVAIPVQHQMSLIWNNCAKDVVKDQSTGPLLSSVTSLNTVAVTSGSANTTTSPTLQSHPTTSVFTFENPPKLTEETQCTALNSTASNITTDESQGSKSEGKVILLSGSEQSQAQNTFYVRTADLQIVMQLISDEQLALIQPHIETPDFKPAQSYCANYRNPVTTKSCDNDDGIDVCVTQDVINNGEIRRTSDKISLDSCVSADSEKKTENAGGLTLSNANNNTGVNCSTVCISSWSHQQTKVHTSASSTNNRKNPTKQFYNPHIIPKKFNVTTESHHKQVAGDIVSELDLVDKSFSMRQNDKDCSSPDTRVIFSQDQTSTDMNPELNNKTSVSKEKFCLMESNHNQAIQNTLPVESNKTRHLFPVTVLRDDEGLQTMKTTQFGNCFADKMIPITTPSIATSQQMQKVLTSTIQPCQSKLRWPACSASTQLKEYDTESGEDGAPKSLWFQRNPGTPSQEAIPREPKSAGTDMEKLDTKMADTNNPCQSCENNGEQDKRKVESSEEHQTAAQTHLRLSQEVINASLNVSNPAHHDKFSVPNNPAPSVCNILSQTCQPQGQEGYNNYTRRDREDGVFGKGPSQETSQRDRSSHGCGLASASSGLGVSGLANQARRHLLVPPLLVNDKKKETHTRNVMNYWTSAKGTQAQVISPQQRVLQNHCSVLTTELISTSMTSSSCTGLMHSNAPHKTYSQITPTNQICPLATVSTSQTDSKLFYSANNSYLKHEDSNSSSDDEQKLIIELE